MEQLVTWTEIILANLFLLLLLLFLNIILDDDPQFLAYFLTDFSLGKYY